MALVPSRLYMRLERCSFQGTWDLACRVERDHRSVVPLATFGLAEVVPQSLVDLRDDFRDRGRRGNFSRANAQSISSRVRSGSQLAVRLAPAYPVPGDMALSVAHDHSGATLLRSPRCLDSFVL